MSVQESPVEAWVGRGLLQGGGTECSSACMGPFEGGLHYLHYLHHSLASSQTTGSERSPTHQQKIRLKIYWAWPHPSEKNSVSPSVSLCHQEASKSLLSFSIRGQTEWKPQSQKTNQTDHMNHSLVNSMKLRAMPHRVIQDGWVMVESSDKMWPTGKGNGKPFQYFCLENPMNSIKRQKDMTLKDVSPRLEGVHCANGEVWKSKC